MNERLSDTDLEKVIDAVSQKKHSLEIKASRLSIGGRHKSGSSQEEYEVSLRGSSFLSGVQLGIEIALGTKDEIKFGETVDLRVNDIVQE